MLAAQLNNYGEPRLIKIQEIDKPKPGPQEVLVEVYSAGVNPFDLKLLSGAYKDAIPLKLPATLGGDVAGIVSQLGEEVTNLRVGQAVYGQAGAASGHGSFAEFTPVKSIQLAPKPSTLDFNSSAALPLVSCSAYQVLYDHMNLSKGQSILIHGGAGGIGSIAIQLAKNIGAEITTTVSSKDVDYVQQLGASRVIDFTAEDYSETVRDMDAVFDTVGGEVTAKSYKILKPGGIFVSMVSQEDMELSTKFKVKFIHQSTKTTTESLVKIAELVDNKKLHVDIDKVFPLPQAAEALEYLKSGHTRGKVVIQVKT